MSRTEKIILPNTSLCAIVRDEVTNPAGGIVDFVESTVPFVERAVIVDTGSVDGTREILSELKERYPQLSVSDRQFDDFASSRNYALSLVGTKYVLVLDADERLFEEDFVKLKALLIQGFFGYRFTFIDILPDGTKAGVGHNPRLFKWDAQINYVNFAINRLEHPQYMNLPIEMVKSVIDSGLPIKHFCVDEDVKAIQLRDWYRGVVQKGLPIAPSEIPSSVQWKAFNPQRLKYR